MIVRKLIVSDGRTERELLLVGTIVVGRDPTCELNDLDPLLSRRHAEFVSTNQGVTIRDLQSRNGILVNGEKVPEHALKPGDMVQLGHLHMTYVEEAVVKSLEDHTRSHATTDTDIETPTMAPVARSPKRAAAAAVASAPTPPAQTEPVPVSLAAPPPVPAPARPPVSETAPPPVVVAAPPATPATAPTASKPIDDDDRDATRAPVARHAKAPRPPAVTRPADDRDATRAPGMKAAVAVEDLDATRARVPALDETRAPVRPKTPARTAAPVEARVVADSSLIVTEASPSCQAIIGARPETIVGGPLLEAISRGLSFVATGDGPSSLSLSIARALSGKTITITFRAGQATESSS